MHNLTTNPAQSPMRHDVDPDGLLEFSVVYTNQALNHMSAKFKDVMTELSATLKALYHADAVAIVPGGGTYAMETVARQLMQDQMVMVVRNGWFSYRWSQILEQGNIACSIKVHTAQSVYDDKGVLQFMPADIQEVTASIYRERPQVVCAPHVETASGIMLCDEYIRALADAVHAVDGLLVIDCIASGCIWLDMAALGIDVLITAPQKGFSSTPCAGMVMLSERAVVRVEASKSTSFSMDLKAWLKIMQAYEQGLHAYHATMPTDGLVQLAEILRYSKQIGFAALKEAQIRLGERILAVLARYGVASVSHPNVQAYGVIVCHTNSEEVHKGTAFANVGVQIAAGVPLQVGEPNSFRSFRIGLFGLNKLLCIDETVADFEKACNKVFGLEP